MAFTFPMNIDMTRWNKSSQAQTLFIARIAGQCIAVAFVAYISASVVSSAMIALFMNDSLLQAISSGPRQGEADSFGSQVNLRELQKIIKDRNLFNSEGAYPDEPEPGDIAAQQALVFNENAPCSKTSLNIELVGTIFLGFQGDSLATIQERGYSQADIYRKGDAIYGNDQAKIHRIEQKRVIINNNGKKECVELDADDQAMLASTVSSVPARADIGAADANAGDGGGCSSASLDEKYVREQLGTGFDKILSKGRLIPHNKDGQMVGFKLIGMDSDSLFGKVCLRNGDVITQVNETSLQQPDQGFTFYEVFQSEGKIRLSLLRNGTTPMTINVEIK